MKFGFKIGGHGWGGLNKKRERERSELSLISLLF
jgi:hypothetical protein